MLTALENSFYKIFSAVDIDSVLTLGKNVPAGCTKCVKISWDNHRVLNQSSLLPTHVGVSAILLL